MTKRNFLLIISLSAFVFSCSVIPRNDGDFVVSDSFVHVVKYQGETLAKIANWYTSNANNWVKLAAINNLNNPNVLNIGQRIIVPRVMLTRTSPLTIQTLGDVAHSSSNINVSAVPTFEKSEGVTKSAVLKSRHPNPTVNQKNNFEESLKRLEQEQDLNY